MINSTMAGRPLTAADWQDAEEDLGDPLDLVAAALDCDRQWGEEAFRGKVVWRPICPGIDLCDDQGVSFQVSMVNELSKLVGEARNVLMWLVELSPPPVQPYECIWMSRNKWQAERNIDVVRIAFAVGRPGDSVEAKLKHMKRMFKPGTPGGAVLRWCLVAGEMVRQWNNKLVLLDGKIVVKA